MEKLMQEILSLMNDINKTDYDSTSGRYGGRFTEKCFKEIEGMKDPSIAQKRLICMQDTSNNYVTPPY